MPSSKQDSNKDEEDEQLQLKELQSWVLPDVYTWLEQGDVEAQKLKLEMEEQATDAISNLFVNDDDSSSSHNDDFEGIFGRIRYWSSSKNNPNGVGGTSTGGGDDNVTSKTDGSKVKDREVEGTGEEIDETKKTVVYVISESWDGYGDILWASARYLANQFSDPMKCKELLKLSSAPPTSQTSSPNHFHPLRGLRMVELGAGAGVPSYMAMHCGAQVICTDLDSPNRIRSIAESMERNYRNMMMAMQKIKDKGDFDVEDDYYQYTKLSRACPCKWGQPIDKVLESLNGGSDGDGDDGDKTAENKAPPKQNALFDVVYAADCCYMPWLHVDLLNTIDKLLKPLPAPMTTSAEEEDTTTLDVDVDTRRSATTSTCSGVAILTFAIHEGISKEEEVWTILDRIKEQDKFHAEILPSIQLTPPRTGMELKQGFVSTIRLTRK